MRKASDRYKNYFDSTVWEIPEVHPGQRVYMDLPPASAETAAEKLTAEVRSKLKS